MSVKTSTKPRLSFKAQALATITAVAGAVIVPQLFHLIGAASGLGTAPGEIFLPMHLPIILAGLLAGPYCGAIAGLAGPLVSFLLTGMPVAAMLPFMMLELFGYGLVSGLLRNARIPTVAKVTVAQVGGRVLRALAVLFAVLVLSNKDVAIASVWMSILKGIPGLALQWALIPLIVYRVEGMDK